MVEAARLCGVDRRTMLRWVRSGRIPSHQTAGRHHRIKREDLVDFMRDRDIPIPDDLLRDATRTSILVVDDQELVRNAMCSALRHLLPEANVLMAASGFDAGIVVAKQHPDLLILDILMPGMDGIEVVRRLRADSDAAIANTSVIVVSGALTDQRRNTLGDLGVRCILDKPMDVVALTQALRKCGLGERSAG